MKRKVFIGVLLIIVSVVSAYLILSQIPNDRLDKSIDLDWPSSPKSTPEYYAFGYDPLFEYSQERMACVQQFASKKAMWGDLHIHTALSADAWPDGTRTLPEDVYAFAKGAEIPIPTPPNELQRTLQLDRPLDFAAVTDHAETFGEAYICNTPGAYPGYESKKCQKYREGGEAGVRVFMFQNARIAPKRDSSVCGEDFKDCAEADKIIWQQTIEAAQEAYDRTASCNFTSFIGYEYTRAPNGMHLHRNTIFRNAEVPSRPATHQTHPFGYLLLQSFEKECRLGLETCDVLSIPHNSNISGGNAFSTRSLEGFSVQSEMAYRKYRNSYDRLAEITQHKGISECINGASDILGGIDELCNIEALRSFGQKERAFDVNSRAIKFGTSDSPECREDDFDPAHNLYKGFCLSSNDFLRGALLEGQKEELASGVNPFEFGFIGSTDTHISAAGAVNEANWSGHIAYETDLDGRLGKADLGRFNRLVSNPGGLAGVYATENSRDAIFHSMKRREAFATSGPRIEPRFFAGHFEESICGDADWLSRAYGSGTPMGSKLPAQTEPFQLLVQAKADTKSKPLAKLQIVKGWLSPEGHKHFEVVDLVESEGSADMCHVYEDPDYDPNEPTYYYARAVETERPRWSAAQCAALPEPERPEGCSNNAAKTTREMAWSSPIWFTPGLMQDIPADLNGHQHQD